MTILSQVTKVNSVYIFILQHMYKCLLFIIQVEAHVYLQQEELLSVCNELNVDAECDDGLLTSDLSWLLQVRGPQVRLYTSVDLVTVQIKSEQFSLHQSYSPQTVHVTVEGKQLKCGQNGYYVCVHASETYTASQDVVVFTSALFSNSRPWHSLLATFFTVLT